MDTEQAGSSQPVATSVMDTVYYQCHSARIACQKDTLVSVSVDESFGKRMTIQSPSVGSFEDHVGIGNTFHGSRVMKGNCTVNESVSITFDPSKLLCVSCSIEHEIIGKRPSIFLFTDQNFVSTLPNQAKECVNICRVENATLLELFEIAREILGNVTLHEGSIFMFGSVSHLSRMGTSSYAKDWTDVVALTVETWHGSRVCPLIPLILTECVGSVVRELNELSLWFEDMYDTDPQGLREVWRSLVAAMDCFSTGATSLDTMDSYKVLLPGSLQCRTLDKPVTFCSYSSRPVTFSGLPKDKCDELLSILLADVFQNFRACARPEDYLARADGNLTESEAAEQKVILFGASNMSRASQFFSEYEPCNENHSVPGWTPTAENIRKLSELVEAKAKGRVAFVFDILSNSAVRYEQFDGTTALPFKSSGRYHLGGGVVPTPVTTFRKVIEHVLPIFKSKGNNPCIIVPPLPRYVFSRCCSDTSHCTNAEDSDFAKKMLTGFNQQRSELIKTLVQQGLTNFKVLDVGCVTSGATTASLSEKLEELRKVSTADGVHFSADGYRNLAQRTLNCLKTLRSEKPKPSRKPTFFWRGFRSPHGAVNVTRLAQERTVGGNPTRGRGYCGTRGVFTGRRSRSHQFHPYRRW
jgi:lysophospholipase L1-like esterase